MKRSRTRTMLTRALRLRCPSCGQGRLFAAPFRMEVTCRACALAFEREPGYFVGAIYINYILTIAFALGVFLALERWTDTSFGTRLAVAVALAGSLPILFHHHSKSLWLGVDHLLSPENRPVLRRVR